MLPSRSVWLKRYPPVGQPAPQERGGARPTSKALTPEQQKIRELEARINRLEREKSISKRLALLMAEEHERLL